MAKYLDWHATNPNVPPEVIKGIREKLLARKPDEFGVVGLNMFVSKERTYCYAEAPSAEAIHKAHEKMGLILGKGDVVEVTSLV